MGPMIGVRRYFDAEVHRMLLLPLLLRPQLLADLPALPMEPPRRRVVLLVGRHLEAIMSSGRRAMPRPRGGGVVLRIMSSGVGCGKTEQYDAGSTSEHRGRAQA